MRLRGLGTARRVATWAHSQWSGGPMILGYHRVAPSAWDPQQLCVTPEHFGEQLRVLAERAAPLSLDAVVRALREGRRVERGFVVTLDDGYADTLETAAPILAGHAVPATVFITSSSIGADFWWCEVEHYIAHAPSLPDDLALEIAGVHFGWRRAPHKVPGKAPRAAPGAAPERAALVQALGDWFRAVPAAAHAEALERVRRKLQPTADEGSGVRALSAAQVKRLSASAGIDIGSHMVTHTSLDTLDIASQRAELEGSKAALEALCGRAITSCSYPNGRLTRAIAALAEEAGYAGACASNARLVGPGCDPMMLPRFWPGDWGAEAFSRWLKWWLR